MSEQKFNAKVQAYLKDKGCYVIKTISTNRAGVPDILACCQGRFIGLEGKFGKNTASALQEHNIEQIKKAGGIAGVVTTLEDVDKLLLELKD